MRYPVPLVNLAAAKEMARANGALVFLALAPPADNSSIADIEMRVAAWVAAIDGARAKVEKSGAMVGENGPKLLRNVSSVEATTWHDEVASALERKRGRGQ